KLKIKEIVRQYLSLDRRIPGLGHRIYKVDPRSKLLFALAKKERLSQEYIDLTEEIQKELSGMKKKELPVNIDGSIAAILCTFGWNPALGKAVFMIARTPGLSAQYLASKGL
ncbi:citryl-CoA lyase, partial [Candidatus Woesebacteria bacterium]|nr:citryl-CoA lyase [Candidatus Woesebacteria bacterium]